MPTTTSAVPTDRGGSDSAIERFQRWVVPELKFVRWCCRQYRLGEGVDADDLVQEVLMRAFRGIDHFDGRYPRAWLATIARNTAISMTRRTANHRWGPFDEQRHSRTGDAWHSGPETGALARIRYKMLVDAIGQLPPPFRRTLELVDLMGMSYRQAAQVLDVPVGTIMSRLHRGRARLRESLAPDGEPLRGRVMEPSPTEASSTSRQVGGI